MSTVGSLDEPMNRIPTYDPIYREVIGHGLKEYLRDKYQLRTRNLDFLFRVEESFHFQFSKELEE